MKPTPTQFDSDRRQHRETRLRRLEYLVSALDDAIVIPGTEIRIGLDPIIGLIPGIGDGLGLLCSSVLLIQAAKLGAPKRTLWRLLGNVGVDAIVGLVPVLGDLLDFGYKANRRNLDILNALPEESWRDVRDGHSIVMLLLGAVLILAAGAITLGALLLRSLYRFITG